MNEREIFLAALDIVDLAARREFLDRACQDNRSLRDSVEALFRSHESTESFLQTPLVEHLPEVPAVIASAGSEGARPTDETVRLSPEQMDADDSEDVGLTLGFLLPSTRPGSLGQLAHYEILEVLGQGAFGTVLKGFDEKLHRMVAIKIMSTELASTSPARKRFLREARSAAAIRHDNVVAIYAVEEKPLPYLVMEYIPGQTLQQLLDASGPLDQTVILKLGQQIADGLAAAHIQGLVHRDIKPANILLEDGVHMKVKITDFGLARAADDATLTQSGIIAGTPMYMSPEQAYGHPLDQRSDLFGFGSVLYQMVTGRPPFRAATTLAVLKRVTEDTPRAIQEIIPETPDWLVAIIWKLLAKNPDERFQSTTELAELLARCRDELKHNGKVTSFPNLMPATPAPATAPVTIATSRPSTGSRGRQFAGAAIALLMIVGSVVLFQNWKSTRSQTELPPVSKSVASQPDVKPNVPKTDTHDVPAAEPNPAVAIAPSETTPATKTSAESTAPRGLPAEFANSIGMQFVIVPKGKSWLGGGPDRVGEKVVEITADFYLGKHEVTQEQWERVMGENPSFFSRTGTGMNAVQNLSDADLLRLPVDNVTWDQCQVFIAKLNKWEAEKGWIYRLPTEIEWEYACRGGSMSEKWDSAFDYYPPQPTNTLMLVDANFNNGTPDNYIGLNRPSKVGSFAPNALGLHDMHGNVWEWCADSDTTNEGLPGYSNRGGSWGSPAYDCTAACRAVRIPSNLSQSHGVRLARARLYDAETQRIVALPAEQQVEEVRKELMRRNPGFNGELTHVIENGAVVALKCKSNGVRDITPLRVLKQLRWLDCSGVDRVGEVTDLSPLIGLPLKRLDCHSNKITDLTPLKGMQLTNFCCTANPISDLSPLRDMPLQELRCEATQVADLSPLKGMRLISAIFEGTLVSDLTPLKGMPLHEVSIGRGVTDLSPLKGAPLGSVTCAGALNLTDLAPLEGMPLKYLNLHFTGVSNLSVLKGMPLEKVLIPDTNVVDLGPLKDTLTLEHLHCDKSITDLSPLKGLSLKRLVCDFQPARDAEILRSIMSLETINDQPATEFWKSFDKDASKE